MVQFHGLAVVHKYNPSWRSCQRQMISWRLAFWIKSGVMTFVVKGYRLKRTTKNNSHILYTCQMMYPSTQTRHENCEYNRVEYCDHGEAQFQLHQIDLRERRGDIKNYIPDISFPTTLLSGTLMT